VQALNLMYTDAIDHDSRVLRFVIGMMGAGRVMLGSDQVATISGGTAQKLFRIN
jgi:hypothetical protein